MEKEVSAEGEWVETTNYHDPQENPTAIWDRAWYKRDSSGDTRVTAEDEGVFVIRIAPWYPSVALRGKFLVHADQDGFNIGAPIPGNLVPHIFDTLEEAQAVYDLITEKD